MHLRKRLIAFSTLAFIVSASLGMHSCIRNYCETVTCNNGGVCVHGACACPSGFEGSRCDNTWNQKFAGTWHVDEIAQRDTNAADHKLFDIQIAGNATQDSFFVSGFAGAPNIVLCTRTAYRSFSVQPEQRLLDTTITIKTGAGNLDSVSGNITGGYTYAKKLDTRDTSITVNFTWKK